MVVAVALVAVVGVTGASAFTTATVARDAQIDVETDANSIIEIEDGSAPGASVTNDGQIELDADGDSLNQGANFTYGDETDPTSNAVFKVTNSDDAEQQFTLEYDADSDSSGVVKLFVMEQGASDSIVINSGGSETVTVSSTNTVYVAMAVETPDSVSDASGTSGEISGTLYINATAT
jgi:hypothetical protein